MLAEAVQPAERHEQLPGAMNVDGIRLVVVIFRAAVRLEEIFDVKSEAALDMVMECCVARHLLVCNQPVEVVAGVETVDPRLYGQHSVHPRAVCILRAATSRHRHPRRLLVALVARVVVAEAQQAAAEQRSVEHRVVAFQWTVRKQESAVQRCAMQVAHHKFRRRQRRVQIVPASGGFVGFHERGGAEIGGNYGRSEFRE